MSSQVSNLDGSGMANGRLGWGLIIINVVTALFVIVAAAVVINNGMQGSAVVAPPAVEQANEVLESEAADHSRSAASASARPLALAAGLEEALNLNDAGATAAFFADDGVLISVIGGDEIAGHEAIRAELASWSRPGRSFEVVGLTMNGDELTFVVEIADRGISWGRQTLRMVVENDLIRSLETIAFRLLY